MPRPDLDGALSAGNADYLAEIYRHFLADPGSVDESWRGFFADLGNEASPALRNGDARAAALDSIRVMSLIRGFRVRGHLIADLDPLGLTRLNAHPDLHPATFGFTEADVDRPIFINNVLGFKEASLRQILEALKATYCDKVGIEYMHIQSLEQRQWIQDRIEVPRNHTEFTREGKRAILERLTVAEAIERFLDRRYTGTKRFGLDGAESVIPALEQVI